MWIREWFHASIGPLKWGLLHSMIIRGRSEADYRDIKELGRNQNLSVNLSMCLVPYDM